VALDVDTTLGTTRAYCWPGDGEPVVFLHGIGGTSIVWTGYVSEIDARPAYAIDTIGDVGRSAQRVAVDDAGDLVRWFEEMLDALGLDRVHLAGNSYGGFIALHTAAAMPERVQSIALFDPAGLVPVRLGRFLRWGAAIGLASLLPRHLRASAARRLRNPLVADRRMMRMVMQGQLHHRARVLPADPLTDAQLRAIVAPVLLLLGEESEMFATVEARDRAVARLRDVDVEIVAGAGHALPVSHAEFIAARLRSFLALHDPARREG